MIHDPRRPSVRRKVVASERRFVQDDQHVESIERLHRHLGPAIQCIRILIDSAASPRFPTGCSSRKLKRYGRPAELQKRVGCDGEIGNLLDQGGTISKRLFR